jgi:hypothetical protein
MGFFFFQIWYEAKSSHLLWVIATSATSQNWKKKTLDELKH